MIRCGAGGPTTARGLVGRTIVVTRPAERAGALAALIEQAGGRAMLFPAIGVRDLDPAEVPGAALDGLDGFDLAVFVSPVAVQKALALLRARRTDGRWPVGVRVAAVGSGTRRALERENIGGVIAPAGRADSEALLALPELAEVSGWKVIVFRGDAGREFLGDTLRGRGARVEYAQCYRRVRPQADCAPLIAAWEAGTLDAVSVTSGEGLANLCDMLGAAGRGWLARTPMFVAHPRIGEQASALGMGCVRVAGPGDAEMLAAAVAYFEGAK